MVCLLIMAAVYCNVYLFILDSTAYSMSCSQETVRVRLFIHGLTCRLTRQCAALQLRTMKLLLVLSTTYFPNTRPDSETNYTYAQSLDPSCRSNRPAAWYLQRFTPPLG